jgi:hypothetical protein
MTSPARNEASKFARYRARKRAQGLRLKRMWVLDTSAPGFQEEIDRQLAILRDAPEEKEALGWIEAVLAEEGWTDDQEEAASSKPKPTKRSR